MDRAGGMENAHDTLAVDCTRVEARFPPRLGRHRTPPTRPTGKIVVLFEHDATGSISCAGHGLTAPTDRAECGSSTPPASVLSAGTLRVKRVSAAAGTDRNRASDAVQKSRDEDGTTIVVHNLYDGIRRRFTEESEDFLTELETRIATSYAYILAKGFTVTINGAPVVSRPTRLMLGRTDNSREVVHPYIFTTEQNGVEVFLAVGFTQAIPSEDESTSPEEEGRYSSEDAGWTVLCNDRAVLFCDKSALTGWGEAGVPRYHTQFIAIAGIVEFRSTDPSKLPTTTTKRGVDASSPLYLSVKNKMREGMGYFTDFTYKWKSREHEARKHILDGRPATFAEIKTKARTLPLAATRKTILPGRQYRPRLPRPPQLEPTRRRIAFVKSAEDVKVVARHLLGDDEVTASKVGEACFDAFLSEANQ